MRAAFAIAGGGYFGLLMSCSLVTTWDGLTSDGAGGAASDAGSVDESDAGDGPAEASACTATRYYCGGDGVPGGDNTLYRCGADASVSVSEVCAYGCVVRPGENDTCRCQPGGYYCGGDKVEGDLDTLYKCNADGSGSFVQKCQNGCVWVAKNDDVCG